MPSPDSEAEMKQALETLCKDVDNLRRMFSTEVENIKAALHDLVVLNLSIKRRVDALSDFISDLNEASGPSPLDTNTTLATHVGTLDSKEK